MELEATSGRDLSGWAKIWLETAGVNTLRPEIITAADGTITSFAVLQSATADYPTIRPHRLAVGFYDLDASGALVRTYREELDVDGERTDVPALVGRSRPAMVLINDDDLAYAKIRLDGDSLAVATEHLADIADPLARSLVWGSAWDATRDGETSPSLYVRLVLANIATESESTTIRTTLAQLALTARSYVDPAQRTTTVTEVGDALWSLAQQATAGSDAQFQLVKYFASIASTDDHLDVLQSLVDGSVELAGLVIDTDLRWEILEGLVVGGRASQTQIDAALESDNTANGQQAAARATAALPTSDGKRAAFDSLVNVDTAPNAIVRATALGILHVSDPALLAPLVEPYFEALERLWEERSYSIAEALVEGLYPAPLADESLRAATQAWLDTHLDAAPALRRLVVENLAGVERAIAAQAVDAR